jgi:hypothetical protein
MPWSSAWTGHENDRLLRWESLSRTRLSGLDTGTRQLVGRLDICSCACSLPKSEALVGSLRLDCWSCTRAIEAVLGAVEGDLARHVMAASESQNSIGARHVPTHGCARCLVSAFVPWQAKPFRLTSHRDLPCRPLGPARPLRNQRAQSEQHPLSRLASMRNDQHAAKHRVPRSQLQRTPRRAARNLLIRRIRRRRDPRRRSGALHNERSMRLTASAASWMRCRTESTFAIGSISRGSWNSLTRS